jgi:hypothetical protein
MLRLGEPMNSNDADKIFSGRVQPQRNDALDAPFANSISLATDLGYSQRAAPENRSSMFTGRTTFYLRRSRRMQSF